MKLGFVSAILAEQSFEEVIDFASQNGFACVELMCWPMGKAERRYAGVTHIDVNAVDGTLAESIKKYAEEKEVELSVLGYYPNPLDPDGEKRAFYAGHIKKTIEAAAALDIGIVSTFIGRDKSKNVKDNLDMFKEVWLPIVKHAEKHGVKIAIENCPMFFTTDEWPGGVNIATTPAIWRQMFEMIPSDCFGLSYDPSHFVWQQMDCIKPIYEFKDKIFYVHLKDAKVHVDKLNEVGIMATPLEFHSPKLPGLGDVNWSRFISALNDIRYTSSICIEVEDKAFEDTLENRQKALLISKRYLSQYVS